jgi:hypothetical protein
MRMAWTGVLRAVEASRLARPLMAPGIVLGVVTLFMLYLYATRGVSNNADDASLILQSQAMLHGNFLLRGWYLPPDSYITTDMALNAVGSIFFDGAQLLKISPAFLYTATVAVAAVLASRIVAAASRWLAVIACLALIAFPVGRLFGFSMQSPMHIGTALATLIAWLAYDHFVKRPTSRGLWGVFILVTTLSIIGDPLAEVLIVAPAGIVSGWMLWRSRGHDTTARATLGGATLALLLGLGLRQALIASGTYIESASMGPVFPSAVWPHIQWLLEGIFTLFHVDVRQQLGLQQSPFFNVLDGGFLLVGVVGFVRLFHHALVPRDMRDSLPNVLSWGIVGSILAFLCTNAAFDVGQLRYLTPAFIYAGVLCYPAFAQIFAGRYLPHVVVAFLAASGLTFGIMLAQTPRAGTPAQPLVAFLLSHHLTSGLGSYWTANLTNLWANGRLHVVPVAASQDGIHARQWQANATWFDPSRLGAARFVVIDWHESEGAYLQAVVSSFGAPDHIYHLPGPSRCVIFVWEHGIVNGTLGLR